MPEKSKQSFHHLSVLSREIIAGLKISPHGHYLDATLGGGGIVGGLLGSLLVNSRDRQHGEEVKNKPLAAENSLPNRQ